MRLQLALLIGGMMLCIGLAAAQEAGTCPAIVETALQSLDELCQGAARNQACYGHPMLVAEAQPDVTDFQFDTPGDITPVSSIRALHLQTMDEMESTWGVALMKLQANLPDTLPGQNVTILLFGDVTLRVAGDESGLASMQAFYFSSGIGDSQCAEVPESGILIQTPKGQGQIAFWINNVDIALGSTAFLQAAAGDALIVSLLEGQALVTAFDETQTVLAGETVSVPLDANLTASGPPDEPYAAEGIETLSSIVALLPEVFTPTEPVGDEPAVCTVMAMSNVNLRSGPGTEYARAGGLATNESASPTGQALGTDGYVWWQLADGKWVQLDVVNATGNCDSLPVVNDIPPTPTPAPMAAGVSTDGNVPRYRIHHSGNNHMCPSPIPVNALVEVDVGYGFKTEAEAIAGRAADATSILINGEPVPVRQTNVNTAPDGQYAYNTEYFWRPSSPGVYTVTWITEFYGMVTCTTTVE